MFWERVFEGSHNETICTDYLYQILKISSAFLRPLLWIAPRNYAEFCRERVSGLRKFHVQNFFEPTC